MKIINLHVHNFKSIEDIQVSFNSVNIVAGGNGTGKSNFVNVLRFIDDVCTASLDKAIMDQGGLRNLRNSCLDKREPIVIEFNLSFESDEAIFFFGGDISIDHVHYYLNFRPYVNGDGYVVINDSLEISFMNRENESFANNSKERCFVSIHKTKNRNDYKIKFLHKDDQSQISKKIKEDPRFGIVALMSKKGDKGSLLTYFYNLFLKTSTSNFIKIYDFNPHLLKKATMYETYHRLNEDGSNLAFVLREILKNGQQNKKFMRLAKRYLPFITKINSVNNSDGSLTYKIQESYSDCSLVARFISDGTVCVLALIVALCFDNHTDIIVLEEPERNLYPKLMKDIISLINDNTHNKQIIITTHNRDFISNAKLDDIRFLRRNSSGNTIFNSPVSNKKLMNFINSGVPLEELMLDDMVTM